MNQTDYLMPTVPPDSSRTEPRVAAAQLIVAADPAWAERSLSAARPAASIVAAEEAL